LGHFYVRVLPLLVSWESAFLSTCVTAFLKLKSSPLWQLLFARNLLVIPLVGHGNQNNCLPRSIEGILLKQYQNVGFVASWIKEFGNSEKVWVAWNTEFPYLLCHNTLGVCTVVRKAAYLAAGGMKSLLAENLEDYECWVNMCEKGWLGVVISELHYFYRIRSDSRLQNSNREQLLYLYELIAEEHPQLYQDYGAEIYHLLNQNSASWLWDNPSQNTVEFNVNMTGMEILSLVTNKLKKVYSDGGISLILNRSLLVEKSLLRTWR